MQTKTASILLALTSACTAPLAPAPAVVNTHIDTAQDVGDVLDLDVPMAPDLHAELPTEVAAVLPADVGDSGIDVAPDLVPAKEIEPGEVLADGVKSAGPDSDAVDTAAPSGGAGKAPKIVVNPWPPPCAKPHVYGDGGKDYAGPNCFDPPSYCKYPGGGAASPACSADGQFCCQFPSACLPCEWVSCFGCPKDPDCPPQCLAQPLYWEPGGEVWSTPACVEFGKIVATHDCALCDADVYCKWKTAP